MRVKRSVPIAREQTRQLAIQRTERQLAQLWTRAVVDESRGNRQAAAHEAEILALLQSLRGR